MFTYVKLKNYKSLVDLTVDLCTKNNIPKNFICIYGANGSGKTNFSSVFKTLSDTLKTLQIRDIRERILSEREMGKILIIIIFVLFIMTFLILLQKIKQLTPLKI